jgi:hypothetical protein
MNFVYSYFGLKGAGDLEAYEQKFIQHLS